MIFFFLILHKKKNYCKQIGNCLPSTTIAHPWVIRNMTFKWLTRQMLWHKSWSLHYCDTKLILIIIHKLQTFTHTKHHNYTCITSCIALAKCHMAQYYDLIFTMNIIINTHFNLFSKLRMTHTMANKLLFGHKYSWYSKFVRIMIYQHMDKLIILQDHDHEIRIGQQMTS